MTTKKKNRLSSDDAPPGFSKACRLGLGLGFGLGLGLGFGLGLGLALTQP